MRKRRAATPESDPAAPPAGATTPRKDRGRLGLPSTPGEQLFLIAVGCFLLTYAVALARTRSLEWALVVGTLALGVVVVAGTVVLRVITPAATPQTGTAVDLRLPADDEEGEHAEAS